MLGEIYEREKGGWRRGSSVVEAMENWRCYGRSVWIGERTWETWAVVGRLGRG